MGKLAFPFRRPLDEWNPHIVRYVREQIPDIKFSILACDEDKEIIYSHINTWMEKWDQAQDILNKRKKLGNYPLAYRLEPTLSEPLTEDPIEGSKFGGAPDFRNTYRFQFPRGKKPLDIISSLWPNCGGCGEKMRFLAGVDLGDWMLAIHYMTANNPTKTHYGSKIKSSNKHYHQHSGLGFGKNLEADSWPFYKPFFQIFYCDQPHFDSPAFDSMINIENRRSEREEKVMNIDEYMGIVSAYIKNKTEANPPNQPLEGATLNNEDYMEIISEFIADNNIESNIPLQTLEGVTLKFDIDIPGNEFIGDWMYDVRDKHPEVFGNKADYQFFGHPYSQQTERRYGCQNTFLGLHRMAPIVNWTDQDQDFSYQIYGCLRCKGQENNQISCKTDGSCT